MADFFRSLKGKLSETIKDLSAPPDPYERKLAEHVERATSDMLTGPDWGLNLELIDTINNDPQGACDKVYRAMRRCLLKSNIQTQMLTLNLLEACVKNCVPFFFQQLIYSDLWQEIMRAGDPMRNWDAEVRDRALGLVEDFGHGLPMPAYKEAYESLLDRGVDFPVRPQDAVDAGVPYYTPPEMPAAAAAAAQGLTPEDRAAIAAAVADLEAEAAQQQARDAALAPPGLPSAGHVPALMGPAVLMGAPIRPPGYQPPAGYHPPHQPAVQPAMVAGAEPIGPHTGMQQGGHADTPAAAVPTSREEVEQALRVSRNSAELLQEMLAPIKASADKSGLHETFVTDLADQCYRYKSVVHEMIPRITDEELMSAALLANEEVSTALQDYEDIMRAASAAAGGPLGSTRVSSAGGAGAAAAAAAAGATAASTSSGGAGLLPAGGSSSGGAGPFTLLGDDEDEGPDLSLQTSRGAAAASAPGAVGAASGDLISLGSSSGGAPPPAAAPAAAAAVTQPAAAAAAAAPGAHVAGEEQLVSDMDQLLLAAQPAKATSGAGAAPAAPQ